MTQAQKNWGRKLTGWVCEVRRRSAADGRRFIWIRSLPTSYSQARAIARSYELFGHRTRLREVSP